MADFALQRVEPLFSGHVFGVERRHLTADGVAFDREVVTHPGAVAILAIDENDDVVLLRQFRAPVGGHIFEIPAGTLDVEGEVTFDAARRELEEETGLRATTLRPLGTFLNSPGYSSQLTTIFLAEGLDDVGASPVGVEEGDMEVVRVSLPAALEMTRTGEIRCAITALALVLCDRIRE